jgi:hypothetical protein
LKLNGGHIGLVDVGPFFPVDLDAHKATVQQARNFEILERFVGHHMAPVARTVADAEKDRLRFVSRTRESLIAPGQPVHGVLGVLE